MTDKTGQITGGAIRFMERVKTGDYEHREVSTELSFAVHEGQDHRDLLDQVADESQRTTLRLLGKPQGRVTPAKTTKPPAAVKAVETPAKPSADPAAIEEPAGPLASAGSPASGVSATGSAPTAAGSSADPAAIEEPAGPLGSTTGDQSGANKSETSPVSVGSGTPDPAAIEESNVIPLAVVAQGSSAPKAGAPASLNGAAALDVSSVVETGDEWTAAREFTDKDLTDAITAKNATLIVAHKEKGPMKIRELIAKYLPPGKPAREIPQAQRQAFLDDLAKLK